MNERTQEVVEFLLKWHNLFKKVFSKSFHSYSIRQVPPCSQTDIVNNSPLSLSSGPTSCPTQSLEISPSFRYYCLSPTPVPWMSSACWALFPPSGISCYYLPCIVPCVRLCSVFPSYGHLSCLTKTSLLGSHPALYGLLW